MGLKNEASMEEIPSWLSSSRRAGMAHMSDTCGLSCDYRNSPKIMVALMGLCEELHILLSGEK